MTQPHVVYLAAAFPPAPTAGVGRALGTAQALVAGGFDLTVITLDDRFWAKYFHPDESLVSQIPQEAQVIKSEYEWPTKDGDIRNWSQERLLDPDEWLKKQRDTEKSAFPEGGYELLSEKWLPLLRNLHKKRPVDLVVATGNPYSAFEVAYEFFYESKVPYVLDYRDAWTLNQFTGQERFSAETRQAQLERTYVSNAAQIWFVNTATSAWHKARYPEISDKTRTVTNAWDPVPTTSEVAQVTTKNSRRFGWIGTVTNQISMTEFEQGWQSAIASGMTGVSAHIYDANSRYVPSLCVGNETEQGGSIYSHSRLSKNEVIATYRTLDALLFIAPGGKYVTTGKVFELLSTGLPIISIHDAELGAIDQLRDYPLWFNSGSLDPDSIAQTLLKVQQFLDDPDPMLIEQAREYGKKFRRDIVMSKPVAELRSWFS